MNDMDDSSRGSLSSKQERVIVCPRRKHNRCEDKNPNKVKIKLEHVLGLTVTGNSALDCDCKTGNIAYPAGCTIVFLSPFRDKQTHLLNDSRKAVTCLTYSPDGRYLATGEYGHQPSIRIWDLSDNTKCCEFMDHKCGINCLAFSPNQKYLVSVGSQHDMIINIWDWRARVKIGANKVSTKIKAIAFCESGDYFITVGNRHVKFWYIQQSKQSLSKEQPNLIGRAAILGEQQNNDFVDVTCGIGDYQDMTYVITRSGILCEFNGRRLLDRWVNVKTSSAFCVAAGEEYLFIGCSESIVRCFSVSTLGFVTTLPRTHYLGVDVAKALHISHTANHPKGVKYPDTIAIAYDVLHKKLTCVYNDHSLYVWDIMDIKKVGKSNSYLYHCACIWGVDMYPNVPDGVIPSGSFITCSSDDTIRVWNLDHYKSTTYNPDCAYQSNIYSNELLKIMYIDPELQYIKNTDIGVPDKSENLSYDDRNGVRSIGISIDGQQLATGDRSGNIRVYGLKNVDEICKIEAHDAEVLCLEYTPPIPNSNKRLLLSASRDRLIHVFDASDYYKFVETLDDHSSSITAIKFIELNGQLQLVSCSADKSIIFRRYQNDKNGHFVRDRLLTGKSTLYDMAVDCSQKYILTACQDRHIRVYNVNNGKQCKNFKGSVGDEGSVIKMALDNSGRYVATSCTDKTLCVFDYYAGECIACIYGHSELVTGLRFSNDCERLISASGDGCVFVWRLPRDMVVTMQTRMTQQRERSTSMSKSPYMFDNISEEHLNEISSLQSVKLNTVQNSNEERFNGGQLPLWVTKTVSEETSLLSDTNEKKIMPRGRWAQRVPTLSQENVINLPSGRESDGSKEDSSVDSGTETSRPEDRHEKLIVPQKMIRSPPKFITIDDSLDRNDADNGLEKGMYRRSHSSMSDTTDVHRLRQHTDDSSLGSFKNDDIESTEHDGDIEDYSEVESGENEVDHKIMYYEMVDDALSEFKVNAIDADELRKSQRKIKRKALLKKNPMINLDIVNYSVSGSQESDDDDDDGGSTPSADNSEKANSLTLSSVDAFIEREKYLKGTFESLSGLDNHPNEYQDKKSTISSQHLNFNSESRNQSVIQAAMQNKHDFEANRKRQELQLRLKDIRGKLECAGQQSLLKSSQSTLDLRKKESYFIPLATRKNQDYEGIDATLINSMRKNLTSFADHCTGFTNTNSLAPRPNMLNVTSCVAYDSNICKFSHFSLPHSPVAEKEFGDVVDGFKKANKNRYSCTFYVDVNGHSQETRGSDYSSDSLEELDTISNTDSHRRCISEYQPSPEFYHPRSDITRSQSEENILDEGGFYLRAPDSVESMLEDEDQRSYYTSAECVQEEKSMLQSWTRKPVARTRSLQEGRVGDMLIRRYAERCSRQLRDKTCTPPTNDSKPRNESFFVPIGEPVRRKPPRAFSEHPPVAHKPPKPAYVPNTRTFRKSKPSGKKQAAINQKAKRENARDGNSVKPDIIKDLKCESVNAPEKTSTEWHACTWYSETNAGRVTDGGLRRSCSLSDLSGSTVTSTNHNSNENGTNYSGKHSSYKKPDMSPNSFPNFGSPISRSSSEMALMPPPSHYRRPLRNSESNSNASRITRPTIASQNKIKSSGNAVKTNSMSARRRLSGSAYSVLNDVLHTEDSSSEDNKSDKNRIATSINEKQISKRNSKFLERSCSERDISTLSYSSNKKRMSHMSEAKSEAQLFNALPDVINAPLSKDLLNAVVEQFRKTADNIIRIHDRIAGGDMGDAEKRTLLMGLRNTIGQVQNNLKTKLDTDQAQSSERQDGKSHPDHSDNMVSMIQQYSDVLVSIVQQKFDQKPS